MSDHLKGVIFDMDGTITVPYIDWKELRLEIGASPDSTLLEHIDSLPPEKAHWAMQVLLQAEREAGEKATLNDGLSELIEQMRREGLRLALVTNNHGEAMQCILRRHDLVFDVALSRDDGELKPSGDLIRKALNSLQLSPENVISIGDGKYDIEACSEVGVKCIYLTNGNPTLAHTPAVDSLREITPLLNLNSET